MMEFLQLMLILAVAGCLTGFLFKFLGKALSIILTIVVWGGALYFLNGVFGWGLF